MGIVEGGISSGVTQILNNLVASCDWDTGLPAAVVGGGIGGGVGAGVSSRFSDVMRYADEATSGLTPRLQDAITNAIRDAGDPNAVYAFRGRAPNSRIWDGLVPQKPVGAKNLWKGQCGLRFCEVPQADGSKTWGYYVSDLDPAWAVTGKGKRINDNKLLEEGGIYEAINENYGIADVIQHGAHINALLDGVNGKPIGTNDYDAFFRYVTDPTDPVYIFGINGYIGEGLLGKTYASAKRGRINP